MEEHIHSNEHFKGVRGCAEPNAIRLNSSQWVVLQEYVEFCGWQDVEVKKEPHAACRWYCGEGCPREPY